MEVTLFGIVIEVKPVQPLKADSSIDATSSPNFISIIEVFPLNQPLTLLHNIVSDVKLLQPVKA